MSIIAGLILSGGQGLRMGGQDKGLLVWQNQLMIQYAINRIHPQVDTIWINANRNLHLYQKLGHPLFSDHEELRGLGPLAGIASFVTHLPKAYSHVQIVPCDTPFLPIDLTQRLMQRLIDMQALNPSLQGIYPQTDQQGHYACAVVTRIHLKRALDYLQQGERRLHRWLAEPHGAAYSGFQAEQFINLNNHGETH
jgi:molybdopterin-guanine dinucleotide biosynthesis protein A